MSRFATVLLALLALVSRAAAGDWYVDPVHGNDANSGTTPQTAWGTLTWANYHVPVGAAETLHLAPGIYLNAAGFYVKPRWRVVGDMGSAVTELRFSGTSGVIFVSSMPSHPHIFGPDTELRGVTIHAPNANGVALSSSDFELSPTLIDIRVTAAQTGLWYNDSTFASGTWSPTFDRVKISNCVNGLVFDAFSPGLNHSPRFLDCEVINCSNVGMYFGGRQVAADVRRCRFVNDAAAGVSFGASGLALDAVFEDCLFAKNSGDGLRASTQFGPPQSSISVTLRRCTFSDNGQFGVRAVSTALLTTQIRLDSTIVARNGDDLLVDPATQVSYSCIEDGDFAGINGNFAADPAFVDPLAGDYRLRWASPCIERGDPATPAGAADLAVHLRPIDGNLDTVERADVGAFEFAPLELFTSGHSGTPATFEFWGRQGARSGLFVAFEAGVAPLATLYGEFELNPATAQRRLLLSVGAGPATNLSWTLPGSAWIGQTIAFQSLTRSSAAPNAAAYSNLVQTVILP